MNGKRLKSLRNNKKMTQEELGEIINVTKVSISGYENEKRSPDTDTLEKIADFFNVSTDYLLGRDEQKKEGRNETNEEDEVLFRKWAKNSNTGAFFSEILSSEEAEIEELREIWEIMKKRKNKNQG